MPLTRLRLYMMCVSKRSNMLPTVSPSTYFCLTFIDKKQTGIFMTWCRTASHSRLDSCNITGFHSLKEIAQIYIFNILFNVDILPTQTPHTFCFPALHQKLNIEYIN